MQSPSFEVDGVLQEPQMILTLRPRNPEGEALNASVHFKAIGQPCGWTLTLTPAPSLVMTRVQFEFPAHCCMARAFR